MYYCNFSKERMDVPTSGAYEFKLAAKAIAHQVPDQR